jgi:hypothetical protein
VIAGLFLVLGALLAFLTGLYLKKQELERQDRRQWDSQILEDYMALVGMLEAFSWPTALAYDVETGKHFHPDPEERKRRMRESLDASYRVLGRLELVGSDKTVTTAGHLVWMYESLMHGFDASILRAEHGRDEISDESELFINACEWVDRATYYIRDLRHSIRADMRIQKRDPEPPPPAPVNMGH